LTASLLPLLIFIPPGILLFFLFRRLWKRGRILRAERDLLQLPLRYFDSVQDRNTVESPLPDGETFAMWHREGNEIGTCCYTEGRSGIKIRSS
jgi:hypothetical protein